MASTDAVTRAVQEFKSGGDTPAFQKELAAIWTAEQSNQQQVTNDLRSLQAQTGVNVTIDSDGSAVIKGKIGIFAGTEKVSTTGVVS